MGRILAAFVVTVIFRYVQKAALTVTVMLRGIQKGREIPRCAHGDSDALRNTEGQGDSSLRSR